MDLTEDQIIENMVKNVEILLGKHYYHTNTILLVLLLAIT